VRARRYNETQCIELDARPAEKLLEKLPADEMANSQAVRFRHFEHIVRGQGTAGAGHVIDDDRWTTRDMAAQMTGDQARIGIVTAAGGSADNNANCFAFVIRRSGMQIVRWSYGYGEDRKKLYYPSGNS